MKLASGLIIEGIPSLADRTDAQKAWIQEWIAALRSGKYKQGRMLLQSREGEFCCLGVACEVEALKGRGVWKLRKLQFDTTPEGEPIQQDVPSFFHELNGEDAENEENSGWSAYLPDTLAKEKGLPNTYGFYMVVERSTWPEVTDSSGTRGRLRIGDGCLADLNDSGLASFEEIAAILEISLNGGYVIEGLLGPEQERIQSTLRRLNSTVKVEIIPVVNLSS